MRNSITVTLLTFIMGFTVFGQTKTEVPTGKINWLTWQEMISVREQDSIKKKIFIDFTTGWCGWCHKMDATTFVDPNVVSYMNSTYYADKFYAETMDTIQFNDHTFTNSDPSFVKKSPKARGKVHNLAYSMLDGKTSYPSYAILDDQFTRLAIYPGFKQPNEMLGILLFFGANQYQQYHNYLNGIWNQSLKLNQDKTDSK